MDSRFEIIKKIGQGGVGAVYLAEDKNLKRHVAIKRLLPSEELDIDSPLDNNADANEVLLHEATVLSSLQHPNIITVHDVGTDEDGGYIVMEHLEGKTLDDLVTEGAFDQSDFENLANQMLDGIVAAHQAGLQHRDLKPSNIMLNWLPGGSFQIKILDFGLAKFSPKPSLQTIDQTNAIHGSIYFMAPEQFERTELDARSDLYSIGCIFYFALTGDYPFQGNNPAEVMNSHLNHNVHPLKELRGDLPDWLCDWVMKFTHRDILERHQSASDAVLALRKFLNDERNVTGAIRVMPPSHTENVQQHNPIPVNTPSLNTPAPTVTTLPASANVPAPAKQLVTPAAPTATVPVLPVANTVPEVPASVEPVKQNTSVAPVPVAPILKTPTTGPHSHVQPTVNSLSNGIDKTNEPRRPLSVPAKKDSNTLRSFLLGTLVFSFLAVLILLYFMSNS